MAALFQVDKYILAVCIGGRLMAGLRDVSVLLEPKIVRSIRLTELLVAQLCTYSMLSALCFAYPLYLFDYSGSSTLYGAVVAIAFIPGVLAAPAGGILADRGRHREVLVALGIALMTASLLSIPMKRSLPLAVVVVAILCVQYGVQSLLKPMLQIETVRMAGEEKVEWATALVSQMTMASNILGPVVGTAVYGCFGIDALCATASVTFAISALLFGGALKQNASSETMGDCATRTTCRNGFRESIRYLLQNASLVAVILLAAVLNLALVGLTIGAPIIVTKHLGMQSSCVGIVEVAMGLGGLAGSGLVGIWPYRFSFNGICRYVAMICLGVEPILLRYCSAQMYACSPCLRLVRHGSWCGQPLRRLKSSRLFSGQRRLSSAEKCFRSFTRSFPAQRLLANWFTGSHMIDGLRRLYSQECWRC